MRAYLEDGTLAWRDGRVTLVRDRRDDAVPVTLRAVLGARIDALDPEAREVLGVASVIGMRFDRDASSELLGGHAARPAVLERLADAALIRARRGRGWRFAPPAHPRRGVCRRAGQPPAGAPRAARGPPGGAAADRAPLGQDRGPSRRGGRRRSRRVPLLRGGRRAALALGAATEAAGVLAAGRRAASSPTRPAAAADLAHAVARRPMRTGSSRERAAVGRTVTASSRRAVDGCAAPADVIVSPSTATGDPRAGGARHRASSSARRAGA